MPDRAIATSRILIAGGLIVLSVVLAIVMVVFLLMRWHLPLHGGSGAPLDAPIAGAELEPAPQPQLNAYLAEKRQRLSAWGWVDPQQHVAHIPIDVAMQLLVQQAATNKNDKTIGAAAMKPEPRS